MKKGIFTLYIKNDKGEVTKLREFKTKEEAEHFATILKPLYKQAGMKNGKLFARYYPGKYITFEIEVK